MVGDGGGRQGMTKDIRDDKGWQGIVEDGGRLQETAGTVSIKFLSPLKYFFQFSMMFILFKSGTRRSFISFVLMYFL